MLRTNLFVLLTSLFLSGCMGNSNSSSSKGELHSSAVKGSDTTSSSSVAPYYPVSGGNFRIALTDAPNSDVSEVWVNIDRIELKAGKESMVLARDIGMVDLLTLQNGTLLDLGESIIATGIKISQARLILHGDNNHIIYKNGNRCDLQTPSQQNTGLKIIAPEFEIREGRAYSMIIDFDAKKSLVFQGNGGCLLKPVLKWASLSSTNSGDVDSDGNSSGTEDDLTDGQDLEDTNPTDGGSTSTDDGGSTSTDDGGSTSTDDGSTSTDDGSTSTDDGSTSTDDGSTSTDGGGSTSTDDGGSTSTDDGSTSTDDGSTSTDDGSTSTDDGSTSTDGGGSTSTDGGSTSTDDGSTSTDGGSTSTDDGSTSTDDGGATTTGGTTSGSEEEVDEMTMCQQTPFDLYDPTQWPNDFDEQEYAHCF